MYYIRFVRKLSRTCRICFKTYWQLLSAVTASTLVDVAPVVFELARKAVRWCETLSELSLSVSLIRRICYAAHSFSFTVQLDDISSNLK